MKIYVISKTRIDKCADEFFDQQRPTTYIKLVKAKGKKGEKILSFMFRFCIKYIMTFT